MSAENTFKRLGMGEYESRTLAALLTHHDATAEQIADSADIPYTKVYHVLTTLEKQGLIRATLERPKKYRPLDPEEIAETILEKKKDELKTLEKDLKTDIKELGKIYDQGEKYQGKERAWTLPDEKSVYDNVANFIKSAKQYAIVCVDRETWTAAMENEKVINELSNLDKRGVKSRGIIPMSFNPNNINNKRVLEHFGSGMTDIRMIEDNKITYHLLVIDDKKVGFSFRDMRTGRVKSGMIVEDEDIAKGTKDYFEHLWNQAHPTEKIIIEEARKALKKLDDKK